MEKKKVVITGIARTPWGKPEGKMEHFISSDLLAKILPVVLERSGISGDDVGQTIFGQSRPTTMPSNLGHYAWLKARLPEHVPGYTVQSVSGSAIQALRSAYYLIASGNEEICVAGGADSYSAAPFVIRNARNHFNERDRVIIDTLQEAEECTQPEPISRKNQFEFRYPSASIEDSAPYRSESLSRAKNYTDKTISPISYMEKKKGEVTISEDEWLMEREGYDAVLAPNADGAVAMVLMDAEKAEQMGIPSIAEIVSFAVTADNYRSITDAGVAAVRKLLSANGITMEDIGAVEILENSAEDVIYIRDKIGAQNKCNLNGGALAFGLNDGAEGAFMVSRLIDALEPGARGVCCIYSPGGLGIAMLIQKC